MNPPWVGSGCSVKSVATGSVEIGVASSATSFRWSEVVSVRGVLEEGSSVDEVISIKAVALGMPSSKHCESVFWFLPHALYPKPLCDFDL
jgi:hypothetical protein